MTAMHTLQVGQESFGIGYCQTNGQLEWFCLFTWNDNLGAVLRRALLPRTLLQLSVLLSTGRHVPLSTLPQLPPTPLWFWL
jgi:hypothetical protein